MAVTIDATVGGASANAYCTRAEANAYHASRLHDEVWANTSDTDKDIAIVMATRILDAMYDWAEWPVSNTQRLMWPRWGMLKRNQLDVVPSTQIPEEIKFAVAELAMALAAEDRTLDSDVESQGLTSLTAGPVSLGFKTQVPPPKVIPDAVFFLIPPWWGTVRTRGSGYRMSTRA